MGGDNFGTRPLSFTPRWCMLGLIEEYHSISTLPTSHYKCNEWLEDVEIGVWALKWSTQLEYHSISTLPTSHYKYNEWLVKVEIVVWALKWSPQRDFQSPDGGAKVGMAQIRTFHPKIQLRLGLILCNHHHTLAFE
eukprot:scaffold14354_cov36-Cyclotella_meneghiniana.AAC.1